MSFMLTAEVLHGLGLRDGLGPAAFTLQKPGSAARVVTLAPVAARTYLGLMHPLFPSFVYALPKRARPLYLRRRGEDHYVTTLDRGRVVFVGYNRTLGSTDPEARQVLRLARKPIVRRVVVDVRLNPGGDNRTYAPLLRALRSRYVDRPGRLVVLISRSTFSAAENLVADLERTTRAVFVGEDSGGSPNLYGDATAVELPAARVSVNIATRYWQKSRPDDPRVTIEPDLRVSLGSAAFFRGRDPVLAAALAYRAG
jgi:Peptidase family S41